MPSIAEQQERTFEYRGVIEGVGLRVEMGQATTPRLVAAAINANSARLNRQAGENVAPRVEPQAVGEWTQQGGRALLAYTVRPHDKDMPAGYSLVSPAVPDTAGHVVRLGRPNLRILDNPDFPKRAGTALLHASLSVIATAGGSEVTAVGTPGDADFFASVGFEPGKPVDVTSRSQPLLPGPHPGVVSFVPIKGRTPDQALDWLQKDQPWTQQGTFK
jgi:hypothetical protein